jgi:hypothetical protein
VSEVQIQFDLSIAHEELARIVAEDVHDEEASPVPEMRLAWMG